MRLENLCATTATLLLLVALPLRAYGEDAVFIGPSLTSECVSVITIIDGVLITLFDGDRAAG